MATRNSSDVAFFLVQGRNLLGSLTGFSDKAADQAVETTPLGVSNPTHAWTGVTRTTFSQKGLFDDAVGGSNEALSGRGRISQVLCHGLEGNALGKRMVGYAGLFANVYTRICAIGAMHLANASGEVSGNRDEGVILQPLATVTAAGNTDATSVDNGASSANGGAGYLQVTALTLGGYTNHIAKVRHSTDNITFADLLTFAAVTTAQTGQRVTVAGTVNRYLSTSRAWTGGGSGQSWTGMIAFSRG